MNKNFFWDMDASKQKKEFYYLFCHSPYSDYFSKNFNINPTRSRLPLSPRKKKKRKHSINEINLYIDEQTNDNNNEGYADEDNNKYHPNNKRLNKFLVRINLYGNNNRHVIHDNDPIIKENQLFLSPKQHMKTVKMNNAMKQYYNRNSNSNSNRHDNQKQYKDVNLNYEILNKYTRGENDKVHQMAFNRRYHSESRMKVLNGYNRPHHHDKSRGHSRSRLVLDDNDDDNKKNNVKSHPQNLNKNAHTMKNEQKDFVLPPISKSTKDLGVKKKKKKRKKLKLKE